MELQNDPQKLQIAEHMTQMYERYLAWRSDQQKKSQSVEVYPSFNEFMRFMSEAVEAAHGA